MLNATLPTLARKVHTLMPARFHRTRSAIRSKRNSNRWLADDGVFLLAQEVAEQFNYTVQTGPFRGLRYTPSAMLSRHATPMLIGQYERQLYPFLLDAAQRADLVINLGHAEGYYTIGFARLGKRVVAFDVDPNERRICREMARLNHVADRISIRPWCSAATLTALTRSERVMIICDIDGAELELFTPSLIRNLSHCDLIVEMRGLFPQANDHFVRRFEGTHSVSRAEHPAEPTGLEYISFLGRDARRMATEYRPFQEWMIAQTKVSGDLEAGDPEVLLELAALQ